MDHGYNNNNLLHFSVIPHILLQYVDEIFRWCHINERGFGITTDSNEVSLSLDETEGFLVGFRCDHDS
jgi:hypothetical protein